MKRLSNAGRFTRLLAIGIGGMALAALPACDRTPARTVLSVNGLAVPPEEFLWFMHQERGRVISAMLAKNGDKFDAGFWNRKAGNETPKKMLYQRTIDRVKREKVEQLLFVELGLIRNASFASFQAEMERTNRERAADKARGKAVYGPVAYNMLQYFGLWKSGLQIKAKEILKHDRLAVSDEELRASYQQNARLYTSPPVSSWEFVSLTPVSNTGGPQSVEQFDAALKKLLSRLQSGATAQQIKDEWTQTREFEITAERHTDIDAERLAETIGDGDRFATLLAMQPGRAAILSAGANPPQIVKCTSRKPGALQPFEKVVAQIRNRLLQERYDAFVAERAAIADARVDPAELELLPLSIGK